MQAASPTLAVVGESGRRLQTHGLQTNGQVRVEAIRRIPGPKHPVFEEAAPAAWLYEILSPHGEETVVAGVPHALDDPLYRDSQRATKTGQAQFPSAGPKEARAR